MFTDGSCLGNPGPGGWAVLLRYGTHERTLSGGEAQTTNNRMELMAVIEGLSCLKRPCSVQVLLDSEYVRKGMTRWLAGWQRKGWRNASGKPVRNRDLWERLLAACERHEIDWVWIRGHDGNPGNEQVDTLARSEAHAQKARSGNPQGEGPDDPCV